VHLGKLTRFRHKKLKYLHDDLDPAAKIGGERDELDEPDDQGNVDQQLMDINSELAGQSGQQENKMKMAALPRVTPTFMYLS
jgi:hypothetical protein